MNIETTIDCYGMDSSDEEVYLDNIHSIKITSLEDIEINNLVSIFNKVNLIIIV